MIWEKRIAVNANLSGLTLLHMKEWSFDGDLTPILQSLPLLERLIIRSWRGVVSFRAFLPMDAHGTSGLKQTSGDGQTLALLCPRLHTLEVEGQDPSVDRARADTYSQGDCHSSCRLWISPEALHIFWVLAQAWNPI